jgi:hypothetical protein
MISNKKEVIWWAAISFVGGMILAAALSSCSSYQYRVTCTEDGPRIIAQQFADEVEWLGKACDDYTNYVECPAYHAAWRRYHSAMRKWSRDCQ